MPAALLDLPDVRQESHYDCGPAVVEVILRYFGLDCPGREELSTQLVTSQIDGTDPRAIESYLRRAGLGVQMGEMAWEDVRHHGGLGRPVVLIMTPSTVGHYVVSRGVVRGHCHIHCPLTGPRRYAREALEAVWYDHDRLGPWYVGFGIAVWRRASE